MEHLEHKKGEIVGIGGLAHCGMHSLGKVCFGALKPESGRRCQPGNTARRAVNRG